MARVPLTRSGSDSLFVEFLTLSDVDGRYFREVKIVAARNAAVRPASARP
ncbi:MAG: hypothetical protein QOI39_2799, partial [Mycobacterium sp.]|nr:hypothetical protein [Mycobacterium sp.]